MSIGLWLVQKTYDTSGTTIASFHTEQEAIAYAKNWMNDYIITYFEDT